MTDAGTDDELRRRFHTLKAADRVATPQFETFCRPPSGPQGRRGLALRDAAMVVVVLGALVSVAVSVRSQSDAFSHLASGILPGAQEVWGPLQPGVGP
ncbi:MAG: hypothetical protein AB1451_12995 [Nitrospirota bacterium]